MLRNVTRWGLVAALGLIVASVAWADATGKWSWTVNFNGQEVKQTLDLKQDGEKLTGNVTALPVLEGAVSPNALSKLALASPGERVQISGHVGQRQLVPLQPGPGDFFFPSSGWTDIDSTGNRIPVSGAHWVGGRYTAASFHWTLILKKVK